MGQGQADNAASNNEDGLLLGISHGCLGGLEPHNRLNPC
jgi:hypothetical protein